MGHTSDSDAFINLHRDQLTTSGIPELFWPTLNEKIHKQIFDAGETFQLLKIDYDQERQPHEPLWALQTTKHIAKTDPKHVYLIDHTWTFRVGHAKNQLLEFDNLRARLCNILGILEDLPKEEIADKIFDEIWKLCRTYSIGNAQKVEDRLPVWYVMDEIGSAVMHSDTPNCRIVPFFHVGAQITYSLLFPIQDIEAEEFVFADFAEGIKDKVQRAAALLPWIPKKFDSYSLKPEIPGPDYYLSGHVEESLPKIQSKLALKLKNRYRVFAEYSMVKKYLTDERFELVDDENEADILWYTRHFKDYEQLSDTPEKYVNQFPFEYVLTVKDLLALTCRKFLSLEETSLDKLEWFPVTYNLKTEIGSFVHYFQRTEDAGLDNYWIVKPYNLARSLDIHITNNINYITRLPATGPKIAQKYLSKPVLFYRPEIGSSVKFDIRYVILLTSVNPLKAYVYKEFFLRFANKPFQLKNFHDFETHFTVMNYEEGAPMKHMLCEEFREVWKEQYPDKEWSGVEKSILGMLRKALECATKDAPPCGIAKNPQSRALYAADLMLEWGQAQIQPKLLEVNWCPDCERACVYYPEFFNDVFKLLFLDEAFDSFIEL